MVKPSRQVLPPSRSLPSARLGLFLVVYLDFLWLIWICLSGIPPFSLAEIGVFIRADARVSFWEFIAIGLGAAKVIAQNWKEISGFDLASQASFSRQFWHLVRRAERKGRMDLGSGVYGKSAFKKSGNRVRDLGFLDYKNLELEIRVFSWIVSLGL